MKTFLARIAFAISLAGLAPHGAQAAATEPREIIPLDTRWRFQLGDEEVAKMPTFNDSGWRILDLSHEPGVLSAVSYRSGHKAATVELRTAGAAASLRIVQQPSPIAGDVSLYDVTVVDAAGQTVTDAVSPVTVWIEGAARLIDLDTGDLGFGGTFKTAPRNALLGYLLATVERSAPAGAFRIVATAPGLAESTCAISQ